MKRNEAREKLMQLIFQMEAQGDYTKASTDEFIADFMEGSDQLEYFNAVLESYLANRVDINQKISEAAKGWRLSRIGKVDLAVMRLAVTELCYMSDADESIRVAPAIAINEAVNMAKEYGSEDSGRFINGVLGKIARASEEKQA
ncbi:MAG: transcription antitermination factor NusB [Firmicutes bacterium]|nr:transcription antitermination factor NusB [Bacillota bacterium]